MIFNLPIDYVLLYSLELAAGVICLAMFVLFFIREPRRIRCAVLLVLALFWMIDGALPLLLPSTYLPDGTLLINSGDGDDILVTLQLVFFFICFFGGIALVFNGIRVMRREGCSLANALPILFGIMGICYPFLFFAVVFIDNQILLFVQHKVWSMLLYVPGMLIAVLLYSIVYALIPKSAAVDYIIVLGAGLRDGRTVTPLLVNRLKRAIELYERGGKHAKFVVSGGKGSDERVSEAHAMQEYLLSQNIPSKNILLEDHSRNTAENISLSQAIMQKDFGSATYRCAIATSNYHVLRAVILARSCGLNAHGVGGKTAFYYLPTAFIREYIAVIFNYRRLAIAYIAIALIVL